VKAFFLRWAVIAAVFFIALLLTGCGQSVDDAKREAEFTKVCKDGGGRVLYNDFGAIFCRFNEARP